MSIRLERETHVPYTAPSGTSMCRIVPLVDETVAFKAEIRPWMVLKSGWLTLQIRDEDVVWKSILKIVAALEVHNIVLEKKPFYHSISCFERREQIALDAFDHLQTITRSEYPVLLLIDDCGGKFAEFVRKTFPEHMYIFELNGDETVLIALSTTENPYQDLDKWCCQFSILIEETERKRVRSFSERKRIVDDLDGDSFIRSQWRECELRPSPCDFRTMSDRPLKADICISGAASPQRSKPDIYDSYVFEFESVYGLEIREIDGLPVRLAKLTQSSLSNPALPDRLISGQIICLSADGFCQDIHLAKIVERNCTEVDGLIGISIIDEEDNIEKRSPYVVIEPRSYLEAYTYILSALKRFSPHCPIPFERYIVRGKCDVWKPAYIRTRQNDELQDDSEILNYHMHIRSLAQARNEESANSTSMYSLSV